MASDITADKGWLVAGVKVTVVGVAPINADVVLVVGAEDDMLTSVDVGELALTLMAAILATNACLCCLRAIVT
jgi:hypothetical protein